MLYTLIPRLLKSLHKQGIVDLSGCIVLVNIPLQDIYLAFTAPRKWSFFYIAVCTLFFYARLLSVGSNFLQKNFMQTVW